MEQPYLQPLKSLVEVRGTGIRKALEDGSFFGRRYLYFKFQFSLIFPLSTHTDLNLEFKGKFMAFHKIIRNTFLKLNVSLKISSSNLLATDFENAYYSLTVSSVL